MTSACLGAYTNITRPRYISKRKKRQPQKWCWHSKAILSLLCNNQDVFLNFVRMQRYHGQSVFRKLKPTHFQIASEDGEYSTNWKVKLVYHRVLYIVQSVIECYVVFYTTLLKTNYTTIREETFKRYRPSQLFCARVASLYDCVIKTP